MSDKLGYIRARTPHSRDVPELPMISWQALQTCDSNCPAWDHCTYDKASLARCQVQAEYLKDIYGSLCRRAQNQGILNERVLTDVGVLLMPLYAQLMRFLIVEYDVRHCFTMDDKGKYHAHPVFREIRATIKDIFQISREIFATHYTRMVDTGDTQPDTDRRIHGTKGYYEAMQAGTKPPRAVYPALKKAVPCD